jgi:hypothetical protein
MSMPKLTPDKLNGQTILRPVIPGSDSIPKLASSSVFHPPSINVVYQLEELVEREARAIVGMKALTSNELALRLYNFAQRVIESERQRRG